MRVKVFISWSGTNSKKVAFALRDWLPDVVQEVKPFVSSKDIAAGARWQEEIAGELADTSFGLICVTRENQGSPWLNFEAGALAKSVGSSRVIPLAIDLTPTDIKNPLGQFQAKLLSKEDLGDVLASINEFCDAQIPDDRLQHAVDKWWPELHEELTRFEEQRQSDGKPASNVPERTERELLEEVLTAVRTSSRSAAKETAPLSMDATVARVHATADKDEKAEIVKPQLLRRIAELRENGETSLKWAELIEPFPSGGGVHNALTKAFRDLRRSGEVECEVDPEPGPNQGFGGGKVIRFAD